MRPPQSFFLATPERLARNGSYLCANTFGTASFAFRNIESIPNLNLTESTRSVTKGRSTVDHRARFSTLNAKYEDFLFASVCEDADGMRLSVIFALARINVDPWEEATRLAAMPKASAETALLSILDLVSGRSWKSPEAAAVLRGWFDTAQ